LTSYFFLSVVRQNSEIYLESATPCDRSGVNPFCLSRLLSTFDLPTRTLRKDSLARELVTVFSMVKCGARFGVDIHGRSLERVWQ
jgi:hypothetical protein